jgi:hypothetical protein
MKPFKGVVIIYEEGGVVNGENKDWKLFWPFFWPFFWPPLLQTEGKLFVPPLIKVETFLTPPYVDWKFNRCALQVKLDIRTICLIQLMMFYPGEYNSTIHD